MRALVLALAIGSLPAGAVAQGPAEVAVPPAPAPAVAPGRVVGRVIDRETGRPLQGARVVLSGLPVVYETDLDGRFRTAGIASRVYTARATMVGYQPGQVDSVLVRSGATVTVDFALQSVTMELEGISVEAAVVAAPSSEASLLSLQQAAGQVSDGISAQAIARSPDADAADAVTRVTGISVVDDKFVVVRGLPERYNSTLLNGAELSSPDPNRRVVPLDIFPASLLEAIVATKTATPDRPGDFSGGSVEIRTKEFPEEFVLQGSITQGYHSLTTFQRLPVPDRLGSADLLGSGSASRAPNTTLRGEAFAESFRNVWTPPTESALPATGLSLSVGGQTDVGQVPVGISLALTYGLNTDHTPERFFAVYSGAPDSFPADRSLLYQETQQSVDWGLIANVSVRPSPTNRLSWRNLVTRSAEEGAVTAAGYDTENSRVNQQYQVRYVEQRFFQTQLEGEHQLGSLLQSLLQWRATVGQSRRYEPENRQAYYQYVGESAYRMQSNQPSTFWLRDLQDDIASAQLDWAIPFGLRSPADAQVKIGGSYRVRERDFTASQYNVTVDITQPSANDVASLPPEQAFAPENMGTVLRLENVSVRAQPYLSTDQVAAGYLMLDVFLLRGLRFVGGARYEDWRLDITPLGSVGDTVGLQQVVEAQPDLLWSGNLTLALGARTNLRFAGFRSVARPDAREKTFDVAVPVVGACEVAGDTAVHRTTAVNLDARYEFYRRPGEILAVSAFYKDFDQPIVEVLATPGGGNCRRTARNASSATNYGVEFEVRRAILLPGLQAGLNLAFIDSRVVMPTELGTYDADLTLAGQSPFLANANLSYTSGSGRLQFSLLLNYFASRVVQYGLAATSGGRQNPNVYERGRAQLDAKAQAALTSRLSLSLSGRNLTDAVSEYYHPTPSGDVRMGFERAGTTISVGLGYAF